MAFFHNVTIARLQAYLPSAGWTMEPTPVEGSRIWHAIAKDDPTSVKILISPSSHFVHEFQDKMRIAINVAAQFEGLEFEEMVAKIIEQTTPKESEPKEEVKKELATVLSTQDVARLAKDSELVVDSEPALRGLIRAVELEVLTKALPQGKVKEPEGWQLVPKAPTFDMMRVLTGPQFAREDPARLYNENKTAANLYRSLMASAPKYPVEK